MATSIMRKYCLTSLISGIRRVPIVTQSGLHDGFLTTDCKSACGLLKLSFTPRHRYSYKVEGYTQDGEDNIPVDRLTVSYSRSSGSGGQHVNKVNTKAEIRFHVQTADWIPKEARDKILQTNKNRINKAGELLLTSEVSRSQRRNLEDCLQKLRDIIAEANMKPREPTAEDLSLRQARLEKRKMEVLKEKKRKSALKQSRRVDFD
ncbi:hypothetical protein AGOR_G00097540 [Albula goreensis]|uniref:Large ribosomal subunit protein mL62 n=1 Tax=Albula goreensis TaxID=1534307 RepID=A0A8T3DKY3_9TELE|nr:hypothetical protein AGOR_G00097540 [Albula goreensis]